MDRIRRLLVLIVMLVVAGLVVLVVAVRPGLRDDEDAVDTSWRPLVAGLDERYGALQGVVTGLTDAGAGDREITKSLTAALERWTVAAAGTDAQDQVERANRLEALAARARALAETPRLSQNDALGLTITAFAETTPAADALQEYNDVVTRYQRQRDGFWSRIVARLDGYDMRPTLQLGAS